VAPVIPLAAEESVPLQSAAGIQPGNKGVVTAGVEAHGCAPGSVADARQVDIAASIQRDAEAILSPTAAEKGVPLEYAIGIQPGDKSVGPEVKARTGEPQAALLSPAT